MCRYFHRDALLTEKMNCNMNYLKLVSGIWFGSRLFRVSVVIGFLVFFIVIEGGGVDGVQGVSRKLC